MAITEHTAFPHAALEGRRRYVRPPQPIHFPVSEEMPETNRHLELRTALYVILKRELAARATLGSEQFIYYDPTTAKKKLAPDAFAKLGEPHATFRCWKTWLRGAPEVAVEVVSDSDEGEEPWNLKLGRYRAAGIGEVVRFDPDDAERPIRVWDHIDGDLVERERSHDGVYECAPLGLFWVAVAHPAFVRMLRLARDRAGADLLPTPEEAELAKERARAEAEQARDRLAAEVAELRKKLAEQSPRPAARRAAKDGATGPRAKPQKAPR